MLKVEGLSIKFRMDNVMVPVVSRFSLGLPDGGTLAIVGESGCGKSVTVQALMGLLEPGISEVTADKLSFNGKQLLGLKEKDWQKIRGNDISMIFQNPMTSLNPLMKCGKQISESMVHHREVTSKQALQETLVLIREMGLDNPERIYKTYPHELSGGMRQRIMIAMALACRPKLLIADEPTTALDVTIQQQILELIKSLKVSRGMALILITHDLGIVKNMVDNLAVMYAGQIVESGKTNEVLSSPKHPYTKGLLHSIPKLSDTKRRLTAIPGAVPSPQDFPNGCRFYDRCTMSEAKCEQMDYFPQENEEHFTACRRAELL
ncbi:MAG: ABC transporter ATP-binding protein [Fibrobacteria bacterium]|nr:ABC transporter ATP-binding protein [Fibrobacteria bacterium]